MARTAETLRRTNETDIAVKLDLDGQGQAKLDYPVGFMAHMLATFARHSFFNIEIRARGDLETDQHHLVEDTGITLGQCLADALGEKRGIRRSGSCLFPMDETLARAAVDISGRPFLVFDVPLSGVPLVSVSGGAGSSFQVDTVEDFWRGFVTAAGITVHLDILRGRSDHHKIEALFKAAARALREACGIDPRGAGIIPSTKGTLA
ncbi:MAG: imidazoleglycerol-phosphate dehydratase HisB [Treponema sp.]|jgi:imidazoleglycerol-phosphate dehydratase|nr:imidazoleglycerol-phosphate dehydratase HisB [Treponema sp.]